MLFVATAMAFLFIPAYITSGTDKDGIFIVTVTAAAAIIPPLAIILALRKRD